MEKEEHIKQVIKTFGLDCPPSFYIKQGWKRAEKELIDNLLSKGCELFWCYKCQNIIVKPEEQQQDASSWTLHCPQCNNEVCDLNEVNWLE